MPISIETRVSRHHSIPTDAVPSGTMDAMRNAAAAGFERAMSLVPYGATGDLQRSGFEPEETADGRGWRWGFHAPHALPVEYGSRPHWAPIEPLKLWARIVLGDESAAYAVRQKIARYGTPAQPFVRPGVLVQQTVLRVTGVAPFVANKFRRTR